MDPVARVVTPVGALFFVRRVFGGFSLDKVTVEPKFECLSSGKPFTVKFSGRSGAFSGLGGQVEVNSLVLKVQGLRFVNSGFYATTYMRRSKVTESS